MSDERRKVGRPRKYDTRSERQKAYHERKKEKMKTLEEQVTKLEKQRLFSSDGNAAVFENVIFQDITSFAWKKITPSEIALMGIQDLETMVDEFRGRIDQHSSFDVALENITLGIISKNSLATKDEPPLRKIDEIDSRIKENIKNLEERMQQQTLLYLMEAELANRERLDSRKTKLDLFETKVEELEKEVLEKKIKVKKEAQ
ncbi:MAG TPA: hypothetical protein VMX55_03630 [candidate division Zixibacteria bacterium]|nr:hypothetical protein [candidate division Zixibacteria bacterium]